MSDPKFSVQPYTAGALQMSWEASGDFISGTVAVGQQALLFEGTVNEPVIGGTLDFVVIVDGDGIPDSFSIEPYYELEPIL